jgi:hypothetical protein
MIDIVVHVNNNCNKTNKKSKVEPGGVIALRLRLRLAAPAPQQWQLISSLLHTFKFIYPFGYVLNNKIIAICFK